MAMQPWKKTMWKLLIGIIVLALAALAFLCYVPYSSESTESGWLKQVMNKGVVFKTYEGKLLQGGRKSNSANPNTAQSYDLEFSIKDQALYEKMKGMTGKYVTVHYKEYYITLPWRGYSKNIVNAAEVESTNEMPPVTGE